MELVKNPNVDWAGLKWYFIAISLVLLTIGSISFIVNGLSFSVDFTGGTLLVVKFRGQPDLERIRGLLAENAAQDVVRYDDPSLNLVQIRLGQSEAGEADVELANLSDRIYAIFQREFDAGRVDSDKKDLNGLSTSLLANEIQQMPAGLLGEGESAMTAEEAARRITAHRTSQGGLLTDFSQLSDLGLPSGLLTALEQRFYWGGFSIMSSESVGPKVGDELKQRAWAAVVASGIGMLIYIWIRFRFIYGVAAIIALVHDVAITLGFFSVLGKDISLTVIAAVLTLVGYSLNDTIVVFDRVRENEREMRRKPLVQIVNLSINQTLNRTILTSLTFFMAALALYLFGGDALNGFSFALVIGVLAGTFSSVAIASPIVIWWEAGRARKLKAVRAR